MNRQGFTLIELMVVIVIIAILAAIGIPKFANSKSKAYVTQMKSDLRNLVTAEESFFSDSARYTSNLSSLKFAMTTGVTVPAITVYSGSWTATNTHTQLPSMTCGIGVNTTNPLMGGLGEGEPACR